jgi:hypothetical protein
VVGTYVLKGQGGNQITLTLSSDGTFTEKIIASENHSSVAGAWSIRDGNIDFDRLWIPQAFAPPTIVDADKRAEARHPKYTEPGHWDIPVDELWGRVQMQVFPDDDVEFRMVSRK